MARRPASLLVLLASLLVLVCLGPSAAAGDGSIGVWPLRPDPVVVRRFDPPPTPYAAGHRGVDLAGSAGQPVHAAMAGTISFAGSIAGRGVVVVDHGATRTTYEPVDAVVAVGDAVAEGARVGVLESFGSHCWPATCLHWGWIRGETYLDPLLIVGAGPVRLLPVDRSAPVARGTPLPVGIPTPLEVWAALRSLTPGDAPAGRPAAAGRW